MIAHDVLTYVSALSCGLNNPAVEITPYIYDKLDNDIYSENYAIEMREGERPTVNSPEPQYDEDEYYYDFVHYHKPEGGKVSAMEVLSLYSAEPDWGMDFGLHLSPLELLTGGSQGYRHLRYGMFIFRSGIAHRRAIHFTEIARNVFTSRDFYWGIRFSARAIHYMEDLLTPFHTKPFPVGFPLKKLLSSRDIFFTTYNYHLNYERLIAYHLWRGNKDLISAIREAKPYEISNLRRVLLKGSRMSRQLLNPLFKECKAIWGETMREGFVKIKIEDIKRIDLSGSFTLYTQRWLSLVGSVVKGYIIKYVKPYLEDLRV